MLYLGIKPTHRSLVIREEDHRASAKALRQDHCQPQGGNQGLVDRKREVGKEIKKAGRDPRVYGP